MDKDREIRFLIPPFFFFLSLFLGTYWDCIDLNLLFKSFDYKIFAGLVGVLVASLLPLGFLISSISIIILRLIFGCFNNSPYEAAISSDSLKRIFIILSDGSFSLKLNSENKEFEKLYAVATFDHDLLPNGISEWLRRRWTNFNISAHSVTAVFLAFIIGWLFFDITPSINWVFFSLFSMVIMGYGAYKSWEETKGMLEFQSFRTRFGDETEDAPEDQV